MRNTKKILRIAIYQTLNGNVNYNSANVPVYDEKVPSNVSADIYILLSTQQEVENNDDSSFTTLSSIDVEVCQRTGSEVSKDSIDDIEELVTNILQPTPITDGLADPSLIQILNFKRVRSLSRALELSPTESILRNIITFQADVIQQS